MSESANIGRILGFIFEKILIKGEKRHFIKTVMSAAKIKLVGIDVYLVI